MHHPLGVETREHNLVGPHARGFRAHEDLVQLALRGAPHKPDYVRRVARPVRGLGPAHRAFRARGLGEPPSPTGALGLVKVAGHDLEVQTGEFKAKKETELAVGDEIRARIKSFLESQWTTFEKLCSSAEIAKAGMEVAQLAAKNCLAIREFAEGIPETRKPEDPEFVLKAMGALALFDNFKWIIIREGHKLNLVSADASDGGKPDTSVDPEEQEISK